MNVARQALMAVLAFGLLVIGARADEGARKDAKPTNSSKIVGKWEVTTSEGTDAAPKGTLVVFHKNGKMTVSASLAGSSGSGTMIRRAKVIRDYFWRGGERWKIGQPARVSLTVWERVERYEP